MILYNLSKYISNNSSVVPVTGGIDTDNTDSEVILLGTGGEDTARGLFYDETVQILTRSKDRITANRLSQDVYNLIANRFGITLPAVTVKGTLYPAVKVGRISPLQTPGYIGTNENGLHQWSVNFQVTTRR